VWRSWYRENVFRFVTLTFDRQHFVLLNVFPPPLVDSLRKKFEKERKYEHLLLLSGYGQDYEQATPFYPLRNIILQLFDSQVLADSEDAGAHCDSAQMYRQTRKLSIGM
jgi:hypothetical protein